MDYLFGFIIGLIQGLGEGLPFSGEGQMAIAKELIPFPKELVGSGMLEVLLQLGVLAAVLIVFRKTVWAMITGLISLLGAVFKKNFKWKKITRYQAMAVYTLVAMIPLVAVVLLRDELTLPEGLGSNLLFIGFMLILSAGLLFIGDHSVSRKWDATNMKISHAIKLGLFQALSIVPGISRVGVTSAMGMNMGFKREEAVEISFMFSLPMLLGGVLLRCKAFGETGLTEHLGFYAMAFLGAVASTVGAILLLKYLVKKDRLGFCTLYCLLAGIGAIVLHFV